MTSTLGYWNIRGRGQPIRMLLHYVGEDFEDKKYEMGGPPDFDKSEWMNEKFNLDLEMPNLPYYIDDKVRMTHSFAILRYLGKKHGLEAKTEADILKQDMMLYHTLDIVFHMAIIAHNPEFEKMKGPFFENRAPNLLKTASDSLGERKFVLGDQITFVDFHFYEGIYILCTIGGDSVIDDFPNLQKFMKRIEALPKIKKFMESRDYVKEPIYSKMAQVSNGV